MKRPLNIASLLLVIPFATAALSVLVTVIGGTPVPA